MESMEIQQYRGIAFLELNDVFFAVQAPIDSVSEALHRLKQGSVLQCDVCERKVDVLGGGLIIFQFRGHSWTLIHLWSCPTYPPREGRKDVQLLSRLLDTRSLFYAISDTAYYIGYELYSQGISVEKFEYVDGDPQFSSQLRQIEKEEIIDPFDFTDTFVKESDLYIPNLVGTQFNIGESVNIVLKGVPSNNSQNMNFIKSDFERVDYLSLPNSGR